MGNHWAILACCVALCGCPTVDLGDTPPDIGLCNPAGGIDYFTSTIEPEFLKVEEVAARLKVKDKTVRDWIARGELEAYKIGKEWRIRRDHFDEAIEARRVGGQAAPSGGLWDPDAP